MAQSAPHLVVAARHLELAVDNSPALRRAPSRLEACPPEALARGGTLANDPRSDAADLRELWQGVLDRRYTVCAEGVTSARRFVVARTRAQAGFLSPPLGRRETAMLVRVLCGDQQKLIASDLGIACSTASKWYTLAIEKTALGGCRVPLPLVFAAQSWASDRALAVAARCSFFECEGEEFFALSAQRPSPSHVAGLTQAEVEVATLVIEGVSRAEIAMQRGTSAQTVACQLRGIFSKFRLTGRYALIAHAERLGWFG